MPHARPRLLSLDTSPASLDEEMLSAVFAALSGPVRRAILVRLGAGEQLVSQLAEPFEISLQAVSKHIQVLVLAGLVRQERHQSAGAGPVADLFRDGVFGLPWGASAAEIQSKMPGGKWKSYDQLKVYSVADGRSVLGIERTPKQQIIFGLSTTGHLNDVSVEFPSSTQHFGNLLAKTTEVLGQPVGGADAPRPTTGLGAGYVQVLWPTDENITVKVISEFLGMTTKLMLHIAYNKVEANTKEELGLGGKP